MIHRTDNPCSFNSAELKKMNLKEGLNKGRIEVPKLNVSYTFRIFALRQYTRLLLTDIDGTITKEDWWGLVLPLIGIPSHHANVGQFLQKVADNGYLPVYLTARPMALTDYTRTYLFQNSSGSVDVPDGPLFLSPKAHPDLFSEKTTAVDKIKTIRSVADLFNRRQEAFVGAFGNADTDMEAYMDVGFPPENISRIDENSEIKNNKTGNVTSYQELAENVNNLYPFYCNRLIPKN